MVKKKEKMRKNVEENLGKNGRKKEKNEKI